MVDLTDEQRETLDDLEPGPLVAEISAALSEFPEFTLPWEAVVYEDGEIDREALAKSEAVRIKCESLYGTAHFEKEVEGDEDDPERIVIRVLDPREVVLDKHGGRVRG